MILDASQTSILLVEDDKHMRMILSARLEPIGSRVIVVENGEAALAYLQTATPNLILSDAVMPVMDGFTLCRQLKAQARFQNIPFALLTSLTKDIQARSLEAGADDYLSKMEDDILFRMRVRLLLGISMAGSSAGTAQPEPKLLVSSGSSAVRALIPSQLATAGVSVAVAAHSKEAFQVLEQSTPDAILLDMDQGGESPEALLTKIRQHPAYACIPIMLLISKGENSFLEEVEGWVQDSLLKPITAKENRHRVLLLLRYARAMAQVQTR